MQRKEVGVAVGAVLVVILLLGLLGGGMMGWGMMGPGMMGWGGNGTGFGWMGIVGAVLMLLFWVLVITGVALLVIWLLRQERTAASGPGQSARAIDILRERYARGEITKDEFDRMRRDLEG